MAKMVGIVVLMLGFGACGGNDAPAKCDAFLDLTCMRLIECGATTGTQAECVASAKTTVPCAAAVSVDSTYDACVSETRSEPCSVLLSSGLPASCKGVINVPAN